MIADKVYFKGHNCFQTEWAGFDMIKPINVIIGRNNTGKSHLIDLVEAMCESFKRDVKRLKWSVKFEGVLDVVSLEKSFRKNNSGGSLPGNHWTQNGAQFAGKLVNWEVDSSGVVLNLVFKDDSELTASNEPVTQVRKKLVAEIVASASTEFSGKTFRRLLADRDMQPEKPDPNLNLQFDGEGATNIIRRYLVTSDQEKLNKDVVQVKLLEALNEVFLGDSKFTTIQIHEHDDHDKAGTRHGTWEVYLGEAGRGLVSLTNSGSGLKTVLLVLINLLVIPNIESKRANEYVFAFEELENNLHPALQRRLLSFIDTYVRSTGTNIFLTTHSSTSLDFFGGTKSAQIIHVTHSGSSAKTETIEAHFDKLGVLTEIGAKPSDLLQANGIIWVEGPSDRLYVNRWIELVSEGELKEGRDYQCAFYGGALLARTTFVTPEEENAELVNLVRVNPNVIVICDSDKATEKSGIKDRVKRIQNEVQRIPGSFVWITSAKEIENYIPGAVLEGVYGEQNIPDPGKHELFFTYNKPNARSYVGTHLARKHVEKMKLAVSSLPFMDVTLMEQRFDWAEKMTEVVETIRRWNS